MLRALCLTTTLFLAPPESEGANAALKYWQAFATLPSYTAEEHRMLEKSQTLPLDAHAKHMVTEAEYAVRMMHRGAALRHCDWGIGYEEGMEHRFPHAEAVRVFSSLVCLRARLLFEERKSNEAIDDIIAVLTLGRHLSQDGSLISILVCYRNERRMAETIAYYLPQLEAKKITDLRKRLDALPPCASPATSIEKFEVKGLDWFVGKVKEAKDPQSLLAVLSLTLDLSGAEAHAFLKECGGTKEGVLQTAAEARPCFALLAKKLELPLDQFQKEWAGQEKKRAGNLVFKRLFPAFAQMRWRQAQADVRRALLSAAFAVQLEERDALEKHPDPVVGGRFGYTAWVGGFELRSEVKGRPVPDAEDDQPVSLTVGRRGN
jgi:hypothetical protein